MYANEETIQAIIDETLLRIPDKDEHKQFWKNTCIDITNFEDKSIENLEPGAYIHYGALNSVYDLFPIKSFSVKRNPETVAILTSCKMFVLEVDRRYKQLTYQISSEDSVEFTDFAGRIFVYNATDIDGNTGNFSRQFDFLWYSSHVKRVLSWYNSGETFQEYVNDEYVSTTFGYNSIVHEKGSSEYVYSFPEATGTIALSENIPTKLSDLTNDSGYITINSIGNGILTITQNGTNKGTFSANQNGNVSIALTDTTYENKIATSGGTELSLVTTGEKYTWNSKSNFSGAYADLTGLPTLGTAAAKDVPASGNASNTQVVLGSDTRLSDSRPASDVYSWAKASTKPSYTASEVGALASSTNYASSQSVGGPADTVWGRYTQNGGIQPPNYFGRGKVGFLMSNLSLDSNTNYKNFMYMDNYGGDDVGGVTALAIDRMEARAWILQSDANRTAWNNTVELITKTNLQNQSLSKSQVTTALGFTPGTGTVTQVKVGSTAYNPSSGVVSLPAYPTTLPASDVYAWAKASTKPSYTASEVGALPLSGGTLSGRLTANGRISVATSGGSWISQKDINNASIQITSKAVTDGSRFDSIISGYSTDDSTWTIGIINNRIYFCRYVSTQVENTPTSLTYIDLVNGYINKASYADYAGSAPASDVYAWAKASTKPSYSYSEISGTPTMDESAGASTIVKRTAEGQVRAVYYNMSGDADNINSFTSNVAFVSSDGWIRKTSKANFSTWLLTWTKLGSTTGNTVLTYTGTYTEFFVVLDLGFYAETFYFVASALGGNRYFFGGTTNTSDGSSWVLRAGRSNSTYSFKADRVHQDGIDYTSQVNVSVYAR